MESGTDSDSDFSLNPKHQRRQNVGLREPSRSRLRAQAIITASNVNKDPNSEKVLHVRATEQPKDKCCPYCDEMFYYLSGVQTHITHAHSNIVSMKGISKPNVMGGNTVPCVSSATVIGINVNRLTSEMGTNETTTPSTSVNTGNAKPPSDKENSYGQHKRRPKHKGKHYRPKLASPDETVIEPKKKSSKSEFITVTHGIRKTKKIRRFRCKLCSVITESQAAANNHYRLNHPPIKCTDCDAVFNNPNSLRRHKYTHLEMNYLCHTCGKRYPFESDLANHRLKHRRNPGHMCNHDVNGVICGKWFFASSDLTKHAKTHRGIIYRCYECSYTTIDVRYLRAHRYTHSDKERYKCSKCDQPFKHHTQLI